MDREKLEKVIRFVAQENGFRLETVERDYHLTRILNDVNDHLSEDLVFKGGTLLNKV
jgi:predicted nucleotidyltransferase component of viral defense system